MKLHIVCGPPAGGKTSYGRELARREGAVFIDSDVATEPVVQAAMEAAGMPADDRDSPEYKRIFREPVYEVVYRLAEENLAHLPVVIAGPFTRESQDAKWPERLRERFGVPVKVHVVTCAPEVRKRRMEERAEARDRAKLERWEEYLAETTVERPPFVHVWVETG